MTKILAMPLTGSDIVWIDLVLRVQYIVSKNLKLARVPLAKQEASFSKETL